MKQNKYLSLVLSLLSVAISLSAQISEPFAPTTPSADESQIFSPTPNDGATGVPTSGMLSWKSTNIKSIMLYLGKSRDSMTLFRAGSGNRVSYFGLSEGTVYYWQIVATTTDGASVVSDIWSFKTAGIDPDAPIIVDDIVLSENGEGSILVSTTGLDKYIIAGFKMILPSEIQIESIQEQQVIDTSNHELSSYDNTCLIYSNENSHFDGSGNLVKINVSCVGENGTYDAWLTNIEFSTDDFKRVTSSDVAFKITVNGTDGISLIDDKASSLHEAYDPSGIQIEKRKGINIIRLSDGTVKKVYLE